jgi:hypothetical protein
MARLKLKLAELEAEDKMNLLRRNLRNTRRGRRAEKDEKRKYKEGGC